MFWGAAKRARAEKKRAQAEEEQTCSEAKKLDAEARRVQSVVDGLAKKYRIDEQQAQEAKEKACAAALVRGREIIMAAQDALIEGDHRKAWQVLQQIEDGRGARHFDPAIASLLQHGQVSSIASESEAAIRLTAKELKRRIAWSNEAEMEERRREESEALLSSAGLIDFEDLDRKLAQSSNASNRPVVVGIIYSITMPDGEVYVGKTVRDAEARWAEHRQEAKSGDRKPKSLALRYWCAQGRDKDIRWRIEETVMGWSDDDLANAERRWMRMGTLNVMDAVRAATLYPEVEA